MAKEKTLTRKLRLGKQHRRTSWAPFWLIPKVFGKGKKVHPSELTRTKRHWRRNKIKRSVLRSKKRVFKSGDIKRKL